MLDLSTLEPDYYQINNTKKVLWLDSNGVWWKPVKDRLGNYSYLERIEKQPTKVKTVVATNFINGQKIH